MQITENILPVQGGANGSTSGSSPLGDTVFTSILDSMMAGNSDPGARTVMAASPVSTGVRKPAPAVSSGDRYRQGSGKNATARDSGSGVAARSGRDGSAASDRRVDRGAEDAAGVRNKDTSARRAEPGSGSREIGDRDSRSVSGSKDDRSGMRELVSQDRRDPDPSLRTDRPSGRKEERVSGEASEAEAESGSGLPVSSAGESGSTSSMPAADPAWSTDPAADLPSEEVPAPAPGDEVCLAALQTVADMLEQAEILPGTAGDDAALVASLREMVDSALEEAEVASPAGAEVPVRGETASADLLRDLASLVPGGDPGTGRLDPGSLGTAATADDPALRVQRAVSPGTAMNGSLEDPELAGAVMPSPENIDPEVSDPAGAARLRGEALSAGAARLRGEALSAGGVMADPAPAEDLLSSGDLSSREISAALAAGTGEIRASAMGSGEDDVAPGAALTDTGAPVRSTGGEDPAARAQEIRPGAGDPSFRNDRSGENPASPGVRELLREAAAILDQADGGQELSDQEILARLRQVISRIPGGAENPGDGASRSADPAAQPGAPWAAGSPFRGSDLGSALHRIPGKDSVRIPGAEISLSLADGAEILPEVQIGEEIPLSGKRDAPRDGGDIMDMIRMSRESSVRVSQPAVGTASSELPDDGAGVPLTGPGSLAGILGGDPASEAAASPGTAELAAASRTGFADVLRELSQDRRRSVSGEILREPAAVAGDEALRQAAEADLAVTSTVTRIMGAGDPGSGEGFQGARSVQAGAQIHAAADPGQIQTRQDRPDPAALEKTVRLSRDYEENARQVAEKINIMLSRSLKEAEISLDPVGLGKMRIAVSLGDDSVARVNMVVQTGETRDLISESISRLRSLLGQQGITLGDASVEHQGSWGGRSQNEGSGTTNGSASARIDQGGIPGSGDDLPGSQELPGQSAAGSDGAVDYFA